MFLIFLFTFGLRLMLDIVRTKKFYLENDKFIIGWYQNTRKYFLSKVFKMRVKNWNKWPNSRYEWYHFKVFECFTLTIQLNGVIGLLKVSLCQKLFIALPFICLWHAGELYRMFGGFQRWCESQKSYPNLQLNVIDNHIR